MKGPKNSIFLFNWLKYLKIVKNTKNKWHQTVAEEKIKRPDTSLTWIINNKYFKSFFWENFKGPPNFVTGVLFGAIFFQGTCIFCMDKFLKRHFCRSLPCMIDSISRHIFKTPMFLNILVFKHKTKVVIFWVSFNIF